MKLEPVEMGTGFLRILFDAVDPDMMREDRLDQTLSSRASERCAATQPKVVSWPPYAVGHYT